MTPEEIGERIKTMRLSRGMTQAQLGDAVGVSPYTIGMYESGRRKPSDDVIEALADTFNIPKWSIKYHEDEMFPIDEMDKEEKILRRMVPSTTEARIISGKVDSYPEEKRKRILAIFNTLFDD